MNFADLEDKIKEKRHRSDLDLVYRAYKFAEVKHRGQKRLSGDPYISHPLAVAYILADYGLDEATVASGLLHDILEDTETSVQELTDNFGTKITELVSGVTKLGTIDFSKLPEEEKQLERVKVEIENLRRFFLAIAKDVRVVIIKLADRLHNMRTLGALPAPDQKRIARETLEVFAPLADRLGMGSIKAELEDLSFKCLYPDEYSKIEKYLKSNEKERQDYLAKIKKHILTALAKEGIEASVDGRVKHLYSIHRKLYKYSGDFSKLYDLLAVRIIVDNVEDCYKALGIIHRDFRPLIYRIKDYIAVPKPNGYQSLHTTVFGIDGKITEIQIRTEKMHEEAEKGVAAHWFYAENKTKAHKGTNVAAPTNFSWVNKVMELQKTAVNDDEFAGALKIDFFNDRIFVFSPKGDIFDLPEGATPVDFAYEVHTQIGHRCRGAKANGRIVNLDYRLDNRDVVEVILAPKNDKTGPNRSWLDFVKTAKAKQNIRSFFKKLNRDDNIEAGRKQFAAELSLLGLSETDISDEQRKQLLDENSWKTWEDAMAAIGEGTTTARQIIKKIIGQKFFARGDEKIKMDELEEIGKESYSNLSGILVRYASCCNPRAGDVIKGYITQGQGITIHRADCPNLLASQKEKIIDIDFEIPKMSLVRVEIVADDRMGLVRDISAVISSLHVNIDHIMNEVPASDEEMIILVDVAVGDTDKLTELLHKLTNVDGVIRVKKR